MTRLPELSYALTEARTTPLLAEFNAILNLAETFGPLLPLDSAVTFYAPLRSSLADLRGAPASFERASEALYLRNNLWRIAGDNNARFGDAGLSMEPAGTNKCTNFNFEPDADLTGLQRDGNNTEAILSRVITDLPSELTQIGNGYVIELDNRPGSGNATVSVSGTTGNLAVHTLSAWVRVLDAVPSNTQLRTNDGSIAIQISNADWQRIDVAGTPANANNVLQIFCGANDRVRVQMIGNQLEESHALTSPIITRGTAGQRARDELSYVIGSSFNQTQGMVIATWIPQFDSSATPLGVAAQQGIFNTRLTSTAGIMRAVRSAAGANTFQVTQSSGSNPQSATAEFLFGDVFFVATRWKTTPAQLQIGHSKNGGAWVWSSEVVYNGAFEVADDYGIGLFLDYAQSFSRIQVYSEDKGRQWIEDNYP